MKLNSTKSLNGEYVFYKNGVEVLRSKNLVTNKGKDVFVQYLSKANTEYASKIVLGVGATTPVATNEFLNFEVFSVPVEFRTVDFTQTPSQVVFRGSIPATFTGVIYESGLATLGGIMPDTNIDYNTEIIVNFNQNYETWSTGTNVAFHLNDLEGTPRLRSGDYGLQITAPSSSSTTSSCDNIIPLNYISSGDKIKIAFHVGSAIPSSIQIKLKADSSNYFTITIPSGSISLGYNIVTVDFDNLVMTGTLNTNSISSAEVTVNATASQSVVTMDSIRFDQYSDISKPVLISHSLLTTPLVVEGGNKFDIEYRLGFDI